jgi:pimeloyl-ACP methyl ester carboxylesterase
MKSLVVIHGALGSASQMQHVCDVLEQYYDVYAFDLSGHGGLPVKEPFSIDLFTQDLERFIAKEQLDCPDVFGYSMGGYVALNHARLFPNQLGRIITLGTKFHWNQQEAEKEIARLNPDLIEQKIPKFAKALEERHAPEDWKKNMLAVCELMHAMGNGMALKPLDFASIDNQVLITVGGKDKMVTEEESRMIAEALPNGDFLMFENFEHPIEGIDVELLIEEIL